jgi:hypothetical protein
MKKRKLTTDYDERLKNHSNFVSITTEVTGQTFFEIGNEITTDLAEAVSIMMRLNGMDDKIWEREIVGNIDEVCPEKCLYWLTGGIKEWKNLDNYKRPWSECNLLFQEEFGFMVMKILRKSKKLKDVRDGFRKHLDLLTLYDFAISQNLIK